MTSCSCGTDFPQPSTLFEHLESGSCTSGWTVQHINALASRSPRANNHVLKDREPWLLAGPPREAAQASDYYASHKAWICSLCKQAFLWGPDLTKHLEEQDCHQRYPNVLKCPECTFCCTKLSDLIGHAEDDEHCLASIWGGSIGELLEYMKTNLADSSMQLRLSSIEYQLQRDPYQPRKLIVRVASMPEMDLISLYD